MEFNPNKVYSVDELIDLINGGTVTPQDTIMVRAENDRIIKCRCGMYIEDDKIPSKHEQHILLIPSDKNDYWGKCSILSYIDTPAQSIRESSVLPIITMNRPFPSLIGMPKIPPCFSYTALSQMEDRPKRRSKHHRGHP